MEVLARILTTPASSIEGSVAWPNAHADNPTPAAWVALEESGAYSPIEVESFRRGQNYLGYRVGIRPDGSWAYFTAGD